MIIRAVYRWVARQWVRRCDLKSEWRILLFLEKRCGRMAIERLATHQKEATEPTVDEVNAGCCSDDPNLAKGASR